MHKTKLDVTNKRKTGGADTSPGATELLESGVHVWDIVETFGHLEFFFDVLLKHAVTTAHMFP